MKTIALRFTALLLALCIGLSLFFLLLYAGSKSKGPLQDLFAQVNTEVAHMEKKLLDKRENRSQSMLWFNQYRNNKEALNATPKILLGAYDDATQESYENIVLLEDSINTKLPIISIYSAWGSKKDQVFPLLRAQAIYDLGSIPMITWEPWLNDFNPVQFSHNASALNKNKGGMRAIAEGKYDAYIDSWAADAKKFGLPFYLRWGHEMNDPYRYPWGQQNNTPDDYIAAWKYLVSRFKSLGVDHVIWVWSPHPAYSYKEFYPGHSFVDWIGLTALNYGTVATWSQWWSFADIAGKACTDLSLYDKPLMLTEFGSLEVGGDRAEWYRQALHDLPAKFPKVKAVVFFHARNDMTITYKSLDWSFEEDPKVLHTIQTAVKDWEKNEPSQE
jgi:hypothetical protein